MPELGKIPPHDIEAEQAILGSMLTDKDAVVSALEVLKEDSFYREDNKAVFAAIQQLYNKNEPIDIITVKAELIEQGNFERVGGIEYLAGLPERVPTTANVEKYIKIVEEKAMLRSLIQMANEFIALGYDESEEADSILSAAEKAVYDLSQKKNTKGYAALKDILVENFNKLEELYNQKGNVTGIPTGFIDFDKKTAGLHNSDLIILAARPAMGKSAFAVNIATNVAVRSKVPVVIFSLEMSKEQVVNRILCSEAMVDSNKVRTGKLDDSDWVKLATTVGTISEAPMYIDDSSDINIMQIRTKCRKLKAEKNIGLIVIDYLQLIQGTGKKNATRENEISEISRSLKILAKEIDVPVIALSQLSRGTEKRENKVPMLSDLRESGSIEQDADIVMFIHREGYYKPESEDRNLAQVILAKHRAGSIGEVNLTWMGDYTKFVNAELRYDEEDMM